MNLKNKKRQDFKFGKMVKYIHHNLVTSNYTILNVNMQLGGTI